MKLSSPLARFDRATRIHLLLGCGLLLGACSASRPGEREELDEDGGAIVEEPGLGGGSTAGAGAGGATAGGDATGGGDTGGGDTGGGDAGSAPGGSTDGGGTAGGGMDGGSSTVDASVPDAGGDGATRVDAGPFPTNSAGQVLCGTTPCACADDLDNDADGVKDLADPECVSSWDNDEGSFATGMPGDNQDDACQDCFFDGNSGSGNDGCKVPTSCLLEGNSSSGQGSCSSCKQTANCQNFCKPYTPNGCDCFGCCEVRLSGGVTKNVLLGTGCSVDAASITGCTECVPNPSCNNTCGRCELCPGKTAADLPAGCDPTPGAGVPDSGIPAEPPHQCEGGGTVCGEGLALCPTDALCQFGCCVLKPSVL